MNQTLTLLDPTAEQDPIQRVQLPRLPALTGITVGLLDISKPQGNIFLDRIQAHLETQGITIQRYTKPTYTRPAPVALQQQIATECDIIIEALAD
ncbi:MAG: hypothetical protein DWQ04_07935 [Chloroflexi bacterium]|nr:MAG: hypothetical protein DWQ04_07935 [Chloroflexota bacterium]